MDISPHTVISPYSRLRYGNAQVSVFRDDKGKEWILKDFAPCNIIFRNSLGRYFLKREIRALKCAEGIKGVPGPVIRKGTWAFAYPRIPAISLRESAIVRKDNIGKDYFLKLEEIVARLHSNGIVHLDLRGKRNILVTPDGSPALIDFGSAIRMHRFPRRIQQFLCNIDLAGIYKHWKRIDPDSITPEREKIMLYIKDIHKFWIFRGYPLQRYFQSLLKPDTERDEST